MIRSDGTLNIIRRKRWQSWRDPYHTLLSITWIEFMLLYVGFFLFVNFVFALGFYSLGPGALDGLKHPTGWGLFAECFFFSVQTFGTIGYGHVSPVSLAANSLVTVEAIVALASVAVSTGIVFSRFSRPTSRVIFSRWAVINTQDGVPCLVFRVANERFNRIAEAKVQVAYSRDETTKEGETFRRLYDLKLRRAQTPLLALTWTVVHQIDQDSPLYGKSIEGLKAGLAQLIVHLSGVDETLSQTIYSRHAYSSDDIAKGHFKDVMKRMPDGRLEIRMENFHELKD